MKILFLTFLTILSVAVSFTPSSQTQQTNTHLFLSTLEDDNIDHQQYQAVSRKEFFTQTGHIAAITSAATLVGMPLPSVARGRATLDQSYERYVPRIIAGGQFYANDLRAMIEKNDWNAIKAAVAEPPKRSKEDKAKIDGGISERASKAGGFSAARVLSACDLFAAAFSDNSVSAKTKKMKSQTEILQEVIDGLALAAAQGLGEATSGGFFGLGGKAPSKAELSKRTRELYVKGGNAYNQYIFYANEELPLQLKKLPYLK